MCYSKLAADFLKPPASVIDQRKVQFPALIKYET